MGFFLRLNRAHLMVQFILNRVCHMSHSAEHVQVCGWSFVLSGMIGSVFLEIVRDFARLHLLLVFITLIFHVSLHSKHVLHSRVCTLL